MDELYAKLANLAAKHGHSGWFFTAPAPEETSMHAAMSTSLYTVCLRNSGAAFPLRQRIFPRS